MAHTPGPWELDELSLRGNSYTAISGEDWIELATVVTRMKSSDEYSPEGLANARLIAAAPELLEALQYLMSQTIEMDEKYGVALSEGEHEAALLARAAIAKAKGN